MKWFSKESKIMKTEERIAELSAKSEFLQGLFNSASGTIPGTWISRMVDINGELGKLTKRLELLKNENPDTQDE